MRGESTHGPCSPRIGLTGSGHLRDAVWAIWQVTPPGDQPTLLDTSAGPACAAACQVMLAVSDTGTGGMWHAVRQQGTAALVPWLPVYLDSGQAVLGPAFVPGRPGCVTCARARRRANSREASGRDAMRDQFGAEPAARPLLTELTVCAVAALAADEAARMLRGPEPARCKAAEFRMALTTAATTRHLLLPDPLCPDCGGLPADDAGSARIRLRPARKSGPGTYRIRDLPAAAQTLQRTYVDGQTGLVQALADDHQGELPGAVARLEPALATRDSHHGYGRAFDHRTARVTALAEALERLGGRRPRRARTRVRARYADIAGQALDPRTLGLYPDPWYTRPGFPFRRYDPDLELPWVWAYSFGRGEPLLIPESLAYYDLPPEQGPPLAYECSNGGAVGSSMTEAVLYGLLEVAERDSFLMTWYARLPAPRVDLAAVTDPRIPLLAETVRHRLGYELMAFATTLEQRVPCFWAMAVDREIPGERPRVVTGASAHIDPEQALRAALRDVAALIPGVTARYEPTAAARLLADSDSVRAMEDHSLLYAHPGAFSRLKFLPIEGPRLRLADVAADWAWPAYDDLTADLAELAGRYLATGLDVLVLNQTSPEHQAGGFTCVKVLVPGTLPITFGHRLRRVNGIPRLSSVPRLLGYRTRCLRLPDEVNPFPHPFS